MLRKQYNNAQIQIENLIKDKSELQRKLAQLNIVSLKKDKEYIQKEKQIATYLECRKTFLGRVRYYMKIRKNKKIKIEEEIVEPQIKYDNPEKIDFLKKDYYTIEDIIKVYTKLDEILDGVKAIKLDIVAIKNKIDNMEKKIKNANLYIQEIDSHEKSIFEFWKFTNKDTQKLLTEPQSCIEKINNNIEKIYDYDDDLKEIGIQIDKLQKEKLDIDETNSIYISSTDILDVINNLEDDKILEDSLKKLKQEAENENLLFTTDKLDIFGTAFEDNTKIQLLGGNKHRETHKNKLQILEVSKDLDYYEYKEKLQKVLQNIKKAMNKSKSLLTIPIYTDILQKDGFQICNISAQDALNEYKNKDKIQLCKLKIKKDMKIIYFSNIVYYDNYNKTLPLGMDVSTKCLIDIRKFNFKLDSENIYRYVQETNENVKIKELIVYEYSLEMEEKNDK